MKFLTGMIFGVLCAIGVMMFPDARNAVFAELDVQSAELAVIAREKSLQSIKSSFIDNSIYSDLVKEGEPDIQAQAGIENSAAEIVWADQMAAVQPTPLAEPDILLSIPENSTPDSSKPPGEGASPKIENNSLVFHAVWSPFRSELSARGFASALSGNLNRSFRVIRLAAGRYEVGFDYSSDQELLEVLDSVNAFTRSDPNNMQVSL